MNVTRIAAAGSIAAPTPRLGPSASEASSQHKRVEPAAIVQVRSHHMRGWDAAAGGHAVQEAGNMEAVPSHALQRVRSVLQRGWDSMRGGHRVQQQTYEPTVSHPELTSTVNRWKSNVDSLATGSKVQHESKAPKHADRNYGPRARQLAEQVAAKLSAARPKLGEIQSMHIDRGAAARLMG